MSEKYKTIFPLAESLKEGDKLEMIEKGKEYMTTRTAEDAKRGYVLVTISNKQKVLR